MNLLHKITEKGEFRGQYLWWCPGCGEYHGVWTEEPNSLTQAHWSFNGNREKPTFEPSILVGGVDRDGNDRRCHCFIRDGIIEYCGDCSHALAGQKVALEVGHLGEPKE
jgi:hypothetical protein